MRKKDGEKKNEEDEKKVKFQGAGQTLRGGTKRKGAETPDVETKGKGKEPEKKDGTGGQTLGKGRTLRDTPR